MSLSDETILVRGVPMSRLEVARIEQEIGGMFFDESVFKGYSKRISAANILQALDIALGHWQYKHNTDDLPMSVDIGDPGWRYVPVSMLPPGSDIIMVRTPDRPAGLVAWFRIKKNFSVVKL